MAEREYVLRPIGEVKSPVKDPVDEGWGTIESLILVEEELREGLRGLADFSHVLVVSLLHGARFEPERHLVRRPRGLADMPEIGIFAQRAKDRPNPIGVTVCPIVQVNADGVVVTGLDAIDGTPILDLKPYFPVFDTAPNARVPEWVDRLMAGYF
ncbi:MAG: tRNA (N6-threonylcarbamoyladenosine(37)-N6)-methyltransferase TrmO [Candidatus Binatia bacterium]